MAKLPLEKVQAAQKIANQVFSLNKAISTSLYGDVILTSSFEIDHADRFDYRLSSDKQDWQLGEYRYNVTNHKIDDSSKLSEVVKGCALAQAKELERLNSLRASISSRFKALRLHIDVYDNKYYEPYESDSYLKDASSFMWMAIGNIGNYLIEMEYGLSIKVQLNIHLDRSQPCSVVRAEEIEMNLGGLASGFESTVR